jgi:hypothetical protein
MPATYSHPIWAPRRRFGPLDLLLVLLILGGTILAWPLLWAGPGRVAIVRVNGKAEAKLQLVGSQREWLVQGKMGPLKLAYGSEGVRVLAAACPNQICVHQGWVKRAGARLICLPSHVVIAIDGSVGEAQGPDGITY